MPRQIVDGGKEQPGEVRRDTGLGWELCLLNTDLQIISWKMLNKSLFSVSGTSAPTELKMKVGRNLRES